MVKPEINSDQIKWQAWLTFLGLALLFIWIAWWLANLQQNQMLGWKATWVPGYHFLGVDFLHNYQVARLWGEGGNPYHDLSGAPLEIKYPYPPFVIFAFSWCNLLPARLALTVWVLALSILAAVGAWGAFKTRRDLGIFEIPLPFVIATVLFSTPALFAIERGNHDILVLILILLASLALKKKTGWGDIAAGICLGAATWLKIYPGFLVIGILALRRWRCLASFVITGLAIGLADLEGVRQFSENIRVLVSQTAPRRVDPISPTWHSLSSSWYALWSDTPLAFLGKIPGTLAALYLLLPPAFWVSFQVFRSPNSQRVIYPYLLWLAAVATFLIAMPNDYNLVFLPIAALAVWDRRDPIPIQLMMFFLLLWWQPFSLPLGGKFILFCKILGLLGVSLSLIRRTQEKTVPAASLNEFSEVKLRPWWKYQYARSILYTTLGLILLVSLFPSCNIFRGISPEDNSAFIYSRMLETALPKRSLILQLPFVPFSQHPPGREFKENFFWGHLYSKELRWSYTVRGREGHTWLNQIIKPLDEFIETLVWAGFSGISLDRYGFADSAFKLEQELSRILKVKPLNSMDYRLGYYDLESLRKKLKKEYAIEEREKRRESALQPLFLDWQGDCYGLEGMPEGKNWRWCGQRGDLYLDNPSSSSKEITIEMSLATGEEELSDIQIKSPWFSDQMKINKKEIPYSKAFTVPSGRYLISFNSKANRLMVTNDSRDLRFKVMDLKIVENKSGPIKTKPNSTHKDSTNR